MKKYNQIKFRKKVTKIINTFQSISQFMIEKIIPCVRFFFYIPVRRMRNTQAQRTQKQLWSLPSDIP